MNNAPTDGAYSIQQVADITGLSKQLIRKWEERYQLIQPKRLDNGYRIYNEKDINILLTAKSLSDQGYTIKQATMMIDHDASLNIKKNDSNQSMYKPELINQYVLELLQEGTHCNEVGIHLILQQAYNHLGLEKLIKDIIIPLLKEIGNRWEKGQWDEHQEALSSLAIRDYLVPIRRNYKMKEEAPLILGACLPDEQHEVPVHLLLLQVMLKGWKTHLIGSSPAPGSIEAMVKKLKPAKVLLSATTTLPFKKNPNLLENLDNFAKNFEEIEFYLGGAGAMEYTKDTVLHNIRVTNSIEEVMSTRI
ncbi:MerR family transcriptional regulator [Neobacillus sp. D3-1R]|uniref:MerR family transcriptional regulator n=1 Tax=Neobacillus sp. D3-1R TaxID=3445778 RepID=UPI003FA1185C